MLILLLYVVGFLANGNLTGQTLFIPDYVAILAAISALLSAIAYFWSPKNHLHSAALIVYLSLTATASALLYDTSITASPFIALAILILVFSGIFGALGLGLLAVVVNGYLALELIIFRQELLSVGEIIVFILAYEVPLIASWIIWHHARDKNTEDRAYSELAQELSKVANKSEIVINAIDDGVIAIDGKRTIQLINPAAQKIIGWGKQDAIGLDFKSILKLENNDGTDLNEAAHPIEKTLRTNEPTRHTDLTLITKSGKKLMASVVTSPAGQPGSGAIIVFRDITKEKAEEREQFEFVSTASHEMRTPIAAIEGYLGLALNPNTAVIDDKARLYLAKAQESAQHLGRLFQDLLDVSRAEDGRLKNNPKVIDVVAFTQKIVSDFEIKAKQKGLVLFFKPTDGQNARKLSPVFYTEVDNDHLREVISNLIDNAIKYTAQGDISVDVTGDAEHITIAVSDTGIGIPPEDLPHLFQKFYRVDNSETREIGGTGLGLYLSRRLVEDMTGRIWVVSEYHKGSTFFVELPRITHEEATTKIEQATERAIVMEEKTPLHSHAAIENTPLPAPTPVAIEQPMQPTSAPIPELMDATNQFEQQPPVQDPIPTLSPAEPTQMSAASQQHTRPPSLAIPSRHTHQK